MKKTVALICLLSLLSLITGCGSKQDAGEIRIGVNLELTGGLASYGNAILNGVKLAVEEQNAKGGLLGKKIVLAIGDNKSEASEAANIATSLCQDNVAAIIGPAASSDVLPALRIAEDNKIPLIAPAATAENITVAPDGKTRSCVFRACFVDSFQGKVIAEFVKNSLPDVKTAVLYVDNNSDYSKGIAAVIKSEFEKNGGKILATETYSQRNDDFKVALAKIKKLKPDVVFAPGYAEEIGKILKQARATGINCPFIGGDAWDNSLIIRTAGQQSLENCYFSNHYFATDSAPAIQTFVNAYKKAYNNELPTYAAALGYDSAKLVFDAISRAGSASPASIREALEKTVKLPLVTGEFSLDNRHNPQKSAVIIGFHNGQQVLKSKVQP